MTTGFTVPFKPLNGTVLVEPITETAGNFTLSDNAKSKPQKGKVIAISDNPDRSEYAPIEWECPVKVGDTIFYKNWGSELYNHNGVDYVLARFREIVLLFDNGKDN